jgi:hypothetical protein
MGEHDGDEEDAQAGGGYCEEIDRDQVSDVVVGERPPGLAGLAPPLGPILAEPSPLPTQDGVGRDDHERLLPPGPDFGKADPEEAVTSA